MFTQTETRQNELTITSAADITLRNRNRNRNRNGHMGTFRWDGAALILGKGPKATTIRVNDQIAVAIEAGIATATPSERLGHASITITLDTYAHVLPDMQQIAVDALQEGLFRAPVTAP